MSEQPVGNVPVVTLFESYGAGAEAIGRRVAERIGFPPFHEQAFSSEQLEENPKERNSEDQLTKVYAAMAGRGFSGLNVSEPGGGIRELQRDQYDVVMQNTQTVLEWAQAGGVIVGRNGALILHDTPGACMSASMPPRSSFASSRPRSTRGSARNRPPSDKSVRMRSARRCR